MWTRDDIIARAAQARIDYLRHNQSAHICHMVVVDTVARFVLDNAATVAEQHGDPEIEQAINDLKDQFSLAPD